MRDIRFGIQEVLLLWDFINRPLYKVSSAGRVGLAWPAPTTFEVTEITKQLPHLHTQTWHRLHYNSFYTTALFPQQQQQFLGIFFLRGQYSSSSSLAYSSQGASKTLDNAYLGL
ncbi:hypothetical protein Salat_2547700 [Sesamum alatum]|uniref:Uncharacterized protein n=1 Tax=Sesamum alatum TaxID=300844 RepID=A0AAE1XSM3_9LAMI|nr:hypothetical protein Salat_2547700 [Sesamum alatum]